MSLYREPMGVGQIPIRMLIANLQQEKYDQESLHCKRRTQKSLKEECFWAKSPVLIWFFLWRVILHLQGAPFYFETQLAPISSQFSIFNFLNQAIKKCWCPRRGGCYRWPAKVESRHLAQGAETFNAKWVGHSPLKGGDQKALKSFERTSWGRGGTPFKFPSPGGGRHPAGLRDRDGRVKT